MKQPLALALVDVDNLKCTNDSQGHGAGDRLLRAVADSIRSHLRPYDLTIRYGGDEFVCVLVGMGPARAAERFSLVNVDLRESQEATVTVGLTCLEPNDAVEDLIARADAAMYEQRGQSPASGLREEALD